MRNITKFEAEVITDMHPLFKSLLWVSIARSKDDDRFILQHLHVERSGIDYHIVATDGKRLHVGTFDPGMFDDDICEIEPGEYEVIARNAKKIVLARADEAGNYPNWKQLMPDEIPMAREVVTRASISRIGIYSGVLLATDFVTGEVTYHDPEQFARYPTSDEQPIFDSLRLQFYAQICNHKDGRARA